MISNFKKTTYSQANPTDPHSNATQSNESAQTMNSALKTNQEPQTDQEKEVLEETQKLTNYLNKISSLHRRFKAQCFFYSNKLGEQLSEEVFSFDIVPITKKILQKLSYKKPNISNISNISKKILYNLAENGEFSSFFNILTKEDKSAVLSKLDVTTKHSISDDDLQRMFKEYPLYTVLQALQDQEIFNKLKAELDSATQYIHGYNQDRDLRPTYYPPDQNNNFPNTNPNNGKTLKASDNQNNIFSKIINPNNGTTLPTSGNVTDSVDSVTVLPDGVTIEPVLYGSNC